MSSPSRTSRVWRRQLWVDFFFMLTGWEGASYLPYHLLPTHRFLPKPLCPALLQLVYSVIRIHIFLKDEWLTGLYELKVSIILEGEVRAGIWLSSIFHHSFQARELQTLHNLRKLFVQDVTTRVKKVSSILGSYPSHTVLLSSGFSRFAALCGAGLVWPEWDPFGLRTATSFLLSLTRVQKWSPRTVGGFIPKNRRFPFLRTTWNSLQRFTNR